MREIKVIKLFDYPVFSERAALWFSQKCGIPVDDYRESIGLSLRQKNDIPLRIICRRNTSNRCGKLRRALGLSGKGKVVATLVLGYASVKYCRGAQREKASVRYL